MKTRLALLLCIAAPMMGFAQESVKVSARGTDVRPVIHDLFQQAKKNYILDPNVSLTLYLSLSDVEFDEAFELICKTSGLLYEVQNGIYFIKADPKGPAAQPAKPATKIETKPAVSKTPILADRKASDPLPAVPTLEGKPVVIPAKSPKNNTISKPQKLDISVLRKPVTTRLEKEDLRVVMEAMTKQTGVQIEVDSSVPAYRIDAFLIKTSLKYALDRITKAAGLNYSFTDRNSILIKNGTAPKGS